jgi:S1-C subfamily serine protease
MSPRKLNQLTGILIAVLLLAAGFALGTSAISLFANNTQQEFAPINSSSAAVPLSDIEKVYADVYARVSPSVVAISVASDVGFGNGSGFVVDTEGHIVTNFHVIEGANEIEVNFVDGTIVRAEIVGTDPDSDLAVIDVDGVAIEDLVPVTFGSSDEIVVGQQVLAIGSPFGQRWTMTAGIVSALDRAISGFTQFSIGGVIQTDAPINPGNSGGPLLNLAGEVVGVNSQINTTTGSNSGIGFAVPSNLTLRVAQELIEDGTVDYSFIGITGAPLTLSDSETLDLPNNVRGAVVTDVVANSPAAKAGLRAARLIGQGQAVDVTTADIITAIDGEQVYDMSTLISYLAKYTVPGDTVTFTVIRDGQTIDIPVTLESRPSNRR